MTTTAMLSSVKMEHVNLLVLHTDNILLFENDDTTLFVCLVVDVFEHVETKASKICLRKRAGFN